jgi:hypothetical protein
MAVIMVSLLVQDRVRVMHPTDGVTTVQEHLSEFWGLRLKLVSHIAR